MLLNCGAAITSFVLVDTLTELPYLHARVDGVKYPSSAVVHEGQTYLIRRYGVGKRWNFVLCHCESFMTRTMPNYSNNLNPRDVLLCDWDVMPSPSDNDIRPPAGAGLRAHTYNYYLDFHRTPPLHVHDTKGETMRPYWTSDTSQRFRIFRAWRRLARVSPPPCSWLLKRRYTQMFRR